MYINIKERIGVNKDRPGWLLKPPPPPGPQIAKYVNVFHMYMKNLLYPPYEVRTGDTMV